MMIRTAPPRKGVPAISGGTLAGFAAGVACTLLVAAWHQTHSAVFSLMESHTLPGGTAAGSSAAITCNSSASKPAPLEQPTGHAAAADAAPLLAGSSLPPMSAPQAAPTSLPDLDRLPHLLVSFGNAAYFELAHNWARSVAQIGAPFLIAAFDEAMMAACLAQGLPCVRVELGMAADNFRGDFAAFRYMGAVKVRFVLGLLEQHPSLPLVVVSDTDTVWLRQPWPYFEQRPTADFFVSSDCLSHQLEEEWRAGHGQPRCGHIPGNDGLALNTGLFAVRNTPTARAALKAWADMLVDPTKERADDPEHRGIDDQLALNTLFERGGFVSADAVQDPRTVLAFDRQLRLQVLPVLLFSNGHVAFVQRTPWKLGVSPIVIHTTFQRNGLQGKRSRLRELGLWHMDPPEYFGAPPANSSYASWRQAGSALRLLTYDNDVRQFVAEAEQERYPGARMPLLEKNWLAHSYQLQALRDGLAAARMLGRTLVIPQPWCWCDYDEHPHILYRCRIKGTDYMVPFECPLDFLVPVNQLDDLAVDYRHAAFLHHPQVPATVRHSRAVITIAPSRPANPFPTPSHSIGHGVTVWPGIEQPDLERAVQPVASAAVLVLRGHVPGFLGGYGPGGSSAAAAMDSLFDALLGREAEFCCFTWGDADSQYKGLPYARPPPLAEPWRPWAPPVLQLPAWCDLVSTQHGNRDFTRLPQHPCAFMRNASLVPLAANDSGQYNRNWDVAI